MQTNPINPQIQQFKTEIPAFESTQGTIAPREQTLKMPGQGEVFYLSGRADSGFGAHPSSYKMGYVDNGQLKYFDLQDQVVQMNKAVQSTGKAAGWFKPYTNYIGTHNIGGQQVNITREKVGVGSGGRVQSRYTATFPDGTSLNTTDTTALGHRNTYGFLNSVISKSLGKEYEGLRLGHDSGGASPSGSLENNIQKLMASYGGSATGQGGLNTYNLAELQGFAGQGQKLSNFQDIQSRYDQFIQSDIYRNLNPEYYRTQTALTGQGFTDYREAAASQTASQTGQSGAQTAYGENLTIPGGQTIHSSDPGYDEFYTQMYGSIPPQAGTKEMELPQHSQFSGSDVSTQISTDDLKPGQDMERTATQRDIDRQNVLKTYANNPNAIANEGFINAAVQAALGRDASKDELGKGNNQFKLVGLSVGEVVKRLGLSTQAGSADITQIEQPKEGFLSIPGPITKDELIAQYETWYTSADGKTLFGRPKQDGMKGLSDKLGGTSEGDDKPAEIKNPILEAYDNLIAGKAGQIGQEIPLDPLLQSKQQMEVKVEQSRQAIADKQLIDATKLEQISKNQPIPMSLIQRQQQQYVSDEHINNLIMVQDYNNNVILAQLSAGHLMEAQRINQQVAADKFQLAQLMIQKLETEAGIEQQEADTLYRQAEYELRLSEAGYTNLPTGESVENAIQQFGAAQVWQDPVSKQHYLKPDESKLIVSTAQFDGHLWGLNKFGEPVKKYGRTGNFNFDVQDDGSVMITDPSTGEVKFREVPKNATLSIGNGVITGMNGSDLWRHGLDFVLDGGKGAEVISPFTGEVVFAGVNGGFGNQVKIDMGDGTEMWFSHLQNINVKKGDFVGDQQVIGTQGNTGSVYSLSNGDGTHLDITIKKPDGSYYRPQEVADLLGYRDPTNESQTYFVDELGISAVQYNRIKQLGVSDEDIQNAHSVVAGLRPPLIASERARVANKGIMTALGVMNYDATKAELDWTEQRKIINTMNSVQQVRYREVIFALEGSVEQAEKYFNDWKDTGLPTGFKTWNKAALEVASQMGGEAGTADITLKSHIADMQQELAAVYKGGNSPTEEFLKQARLSIAAEWNEDTFIKNLQLIRENMQIRKNSIMHAYVVPENPYSEYYLDRYGEQTPGLFNVEVVDINDLNFKF